MPVSVKKKEKKNRSENLDLADIHASRMLSIGVKFAITVTHDAKKTRSSRVHRRYWSRERGS